MYIKKKKIRRLSSISEMIGEYKKKFKILKKKKKKDKKWCTETDFNHAFTVSFPLKSSC